MFTLFLCKHVKWLLLTGKTAILRVNSGSENTILFTAWIERRILNYEYCLSYDVCYG